MLRSKLRGCSLRPLALTLFLAVLPVGASAQSVTEAQVSGSIRTVLGEPVSGAIVNLVGPDGRVVRSVSGSLGGSFVLRGVGAGVYALEVQALGFAPRTYRDLKIRPGSRVRLDVQLTSGMAAAEVQSAAGLGAGPAADRWIERFGFGNLPTAEPGLESWAGLSTLVDDDLGMEGLPGQFTRVYVDGLPFRPVRPFGMRTLDGSLVALTGRSLGAVQFGASSQGAELTPGAGGMISAHTRRGSEPAVEADGAAGAGGLRSAATDPDEAPGALSYQGGAVASVVVSPDTSSLMLAADAWQIERPRAGLFATPTPDDEGLGSAYVERRRGFSGAVRFDRNLSDDGLLWIGGRFGLRPASTDLAGMAFGIADAGERVEFLAGGGALVPITRTDVIEARVGIARSSWTSAVGAGAELPFPDGALNVADPATGVRAGPGPLTGTATRLDLTATANAQFPRGDHLLKVGIRGGLAKHDQDLGRDAGGLLVIGTGAPGTPWEGAYDAFEMRGEISISVPRVAVHAEDTWSVSPELQLHFGGRVDWDILPLNEVTPSADWLAATGQEFAAYVERVASPGGFAGFRWAGDAGVSAQGSVSYFADEVDPSFLVELENSQEYKWIRGTTTATGWPAVPFAVSAPDFRLRSIGYATTEPGPPTTLRAQGGLGFGLGAVQVEASAVYRFTEGLIRRRNLNRLAAPVGTDQNGRELWGVPLAIGSWVGPDAVTTVRFPTYGEAWEIDQGGWSEYLGVTLRAEHRRPDGLAFGVEYTWSSTEDNVPGLGAYDLVNGVALEGAAGEPLFEGRSDLDRPHRAVATAVLPLPVGSGSYLSGVYRYESGLPFTPGYAAGIDANMDGIIGNDLAFVSPSAVVSHGGEWACLRSDEGRFARRNECRGSAVQTLDLRLSVGLPTGGVALFVDALNVLDEEMSLLDTALLKVSPDSGITGSGDGFVLPFVVNPAFGTPLRDLSPGRLLRIGVRIAR